ncbi:transposase [Chromohalobacter canadensis]|uniref:transposase n=1 Tax=Chromohalobacter canadensis TaxID=141389 RepID=UPI000BE3CF12|nr:helix-turn-helix domain-containing protein [Chromohalobacter canadensis]
MNTSPRKRRRFTASLKAKIAEACQQPGTSVAGIALEHALNANLVHKWIYVARWKEPVSNALK